MTLRRSSVKMKNVKVCYVSTILLAFLTLIAIYAPDIAKSEQGAIADPFEGLPKKNTPNCDKEYRFKYDIEIKTADEFINFLKGHQDGFMDSYKPARDKLIPMFTYDSIGKKIKVDLEKVRQYVKVLEVEKSMLSNTRIYNLDITYKDYDKECWPWKIMIQMSDKGCVSVIYCVGK
jgi:hypothetical protein